MNYEKKYNQALERARDLMTKQSPPAFDRDLISTVFPELAESEDERTRKELIEQIAFITPNNDELDDECNVLPTYQKRIDKYRAWLEKQGKQLNPDKVIAWLVANICDYEYYVKRFKQDFGL